MYFDLQKFSTDVKEFRKINKLSQSDFANKLNLNNKILVSLFECRMCAPSKKTFENYCRITGYHSEDYWKQKEEKTYALLTGNVADSDKKAVVEVLEKIGIREYLFALYDRIAK